MNQYIWCLLMPQVSVGRPCSPLFKLCRLLEPRCPLSPKSLLNLITHSLLEIDVSIDFYVKSDGSINNINGQISSCAWYISTCKVKIMLWLSIRVTNFSNKKRHLLWEQLINRTDRVHLHRFSCISLTTTENFNGSNPDSWLYLPSHLSRLVPY